MRLELEKTVKVGDVLTSLTIIVSVIALLLSFAKDRDAKVSEQANKVRSSTANALVKLDRWQGLQLSLYQELQPYYVETSEMLVSEFDVVKARDSFWKKVNIERTRVAKPILDEQLGTAYTDLLSHFPAARMKFVEVFAALSAIENEVTENFLYDCEQSILGLKGQERSYQTPTLGNALRKHALANSAALKTKSEEKISPLRAYLFSVISMDDEQIVKASRAK